MSRLGAIAAVLRLRSTSRVSQLIDEGDRDVTRAKNKNLRIAIDRPLDLLRQDMKPVMPVLREFYPSVSFRASPL